MAGLGLQELIVICIIALLVFGPKKLPDAGKALGQAIRGFRTSMDGKDEGQAAPKALQAHPGCPGCGTPVDSGATFCPQCGAQLASAPQRQAA